MGHENVYLGLIAKLRSKLVLSTSLINNKLITKENTEHHILTQGHTVHQNLQSEETNQFVQKLDLPTKVDAIFVIKSSFWTSIGGIQFIITLHPWT